MGGTDPLDLIGRLTEHAAMVERPHLKLSVFDMMELINGSEPPVALLVSLLAELRHRDSSAAADLRSRIEQDIERRRPGAKRPGWTGEPASQRAKAETRRKSEPNSRDQADAYQALLGRYEDIARQLRSALEHSASLAKDLDRIRAHSGPCARSLHGKVYLTADAPAWLVADVRKSFRVRCHPDKHEGVERKLKAERAFQEAEQVFAKILG